MVDTSVLFQHPDNDNADSDDAADQLTNLITVPPLRWSEGSEPRDEQLPAIVASLQAELGRLADAHVARLERLHGRLEARAVEVERVRAQAMKAALLADKAALHARRFEEDRARLRAERDGLARQLEAERALTATEHQRRVSAERYASMMSVLPWYAWRRRQRLREHLEDIVSA